MINPYQGKPSHSDESILGKPSHNDRSIPSKPSHNDGFKKKCILSTCPMTRRKSTIAVFWTAMAIMARYPLQMLQAPPHFPVKPHLICPLQISSLGTSMNSFCQATIISILNDITCSFVTISARGRNLFSVSGSVCLSVSLSFSLFLCLCLPLPLSICLSKQLKPSNHREKNAKQKIIEVYLIGRIAKILS